MWEDDWYYWDTDSNSNSVGGGAAMGIIMLPVYLIMFIVTTLLARFDLLNSVFVGAIPVFLTRNMGLDAKTTWIIFGVTALTALILQHALKIARIICGIWGCISVGILCYLFTAGVSMRTRTIVMAVGVGIAIFHNLGFGIKE